MKSILSKRKDRWELFFVAGIAKLINDCYTSIFISHNKLYPKNIILRIFTDTCKLSSVFGIVEHTDAIQML
jgi:hypothetical protein